MGRCATPEVSVRGCGSGGRIDAGTNTVAATLPVVRDALGMAIGADAVWVVSRGAALLSPPTLSRIDPSHNTVVETIPLDGMAPIGMAAGAANLRVASHNLDEVLRIGPLPLPATAPATGGPPLLAVPLGWGSSWWWRPARFSAARRSGAVTGRCQPGTC